jgi:cell division protease FtsH
VASKVDPKKTGSQDRAVTSSTARFLERHRFVGMPIDWEQIVGHAHAKRELRVVATALSRRDLAEHLGVPLVSGILMTGPSGSGKTLLARAFAGTVERPVFVLPAAELTPRRIRRVFAELADVPSVVIIDEIDVIARRAFRNHPRSRTVAALCVALDGVVPSTGPITIGLTAEPAEEIDASIIRSGRLTTKIILEAPDRAERLRLLRMYAATIPTEDLDLESAADRSQGMTGADISATILAAAGLSLADGLESVDRAHFDEALERRGIARHVPLKDEQDRRSVAVHEAGHAMFAFAVFGPDALNDVAIARSERGTGHTSLRSEWFDVHVVRARWRERVQLDLAGLIAEELVTQTRPASFGSQTDVDRATQIVLEAIEHGLVPKFGRVSPSRLEKGPDSDSYDERGSESMRASLWEVARTELHEAEAACRDVLKPQVSAILELSDRLLEAGVLSGPDLVGALRAVSAREASND